MPLKNSRKVRGAQLGNVEVTGRLVRGAQLTGIAVDALPDVVPENFAAVGRTVTFSVPEFDPATSNPLINVYLTYHLTNLPPEASAEDVIDQAVAVALEMIEGPGDYEAALSGVAGGTYDFEAVYEYAA